MAVYKVLIVPSSDDEREYDQLSDFDQALKLHNKSKHQTSVFTFNSVIERNAFIEGYEAGIGYLGGGTWFSKTVKDEKN